MRHENGHYISLFWDGTLDAYYIKGHVTQNEGVRGLIGEEVILSSAEVGPAEHRYGRWSCQGDAPDGCTHGLRDYKESGRGRFPVTIFPAQEAKSDE